MLQRNGIDSVFRLLVPAGGLVSPDELSVELAGSRWKPAPYTRIHAVEEAIPYTCVSYFWGALEEANPLVPGHRMSQRALRVLDAVVRVLRPPALWVDALCIPQDDALSHAACLRSMGAIYGRAAQVAVVLSPQSASVLDQIVGAGRLDESTLLLLESDEWVTRAWTYQEMVNSRSAKFLAEAGSDAAVDGDQLLNRVGEAIESFKKAHQLDSFGLRKVHPRLDSLEDLIADWMTASYLDRSAYQVMSSMDRRVALRGDDHFHAMIGSVTAELPSEEDLSLPAPEYFMRVCERKSDFSFLFSSAERGDGVGRGWRPAGGRLPALLPWHSWGDGQSGRLSDDHVELDNMYHVSCGTLSAEARQFIQEWLESVHGEPAESQVDWIARIFERLCLAGFSGSEQAIELQSGYLFPQRPLENGDVDVFVAAGVRWVHGAPAIVATRQSQTDLVRFCEVGVFVGPVPATRASIRVG